MATGGTASNYVITDVNGLLTVNKALLTIQANDVNKTYDGTAFSGDPNGNNDTGFKYGQGEGNLGGTLVYTGTSQGDKNAGTYVITPGGYTSNDYAITFENGALNVAKAALTVTADDQSKTYGGTDPTLTYTPSGTLYGGDTYSVITGVGLTTTTGAAATAGTHTIGFTADGTATNYNITDVTGTLHVAQAPLLVTANSDSKTYDGTAYSGDSKGVTYNQFYYGQDQSVLTGTLTYSGTSQGAVNAGTGYTIIPSGYGTSNGNYIVSYANGGLTINKASLTVTADDQMKTFGDPDPTLTYTPTGTLYGTDTYGVITGVSLSTTTGAAATGGTHPIVATGGTATNYNIVDVNGLLTVNKALLTIQANDVTKTYDGTAFSGDPNGNSDNGFKYGQGEGNLGGTLVYTGTSQGDKNAGTYVITPGGYTSNDYTISFLNGALLVNKAPLTVTADDQSKTYGGTDPTLTYTPSGTLYGGDTYSVITGVGLTTTTGAAATAGTHTIGFTADGTAQNYVITDVTGTLNVAKADLTVTGDDKTKTYGGPDPTLTLHRGRPALLRGYLRSCDRRQPVDRNGFGRDGGDARHHHDRGRGFELQYHRRGRRAERGQGEPDRHADPQTKLFGTTFTFKGTEFKDTGLVYGDTLTNVGLTSSGTPATATPGTYGIAYTAGSATGTGLGNYNLVFNSNKFVVTPGIVGAPSIPGTLRYLYDQFVHIAYDENVYGDRHYYELEVPGTITRELPQALQGIGTGSSMIHTTVGMETVYEVDRFQTYRH